MSRKKWDFRDVSTGLKILRDFLLGRKHTLHGRFPPLVAPRTIPPPDIPRGPEYKYSNQYYMNRSAMDAVKPPTIAPIAEGPPVGQNPFLKAKAGGMKPEAVNFDCPPTPGQAWWWDGHCYFEYVPDNEQYNADYPPPPDDKSPCCQKPQKCDK